VKDAQQFVNLVRRFKIVARYPALLTIARERPRDQIGIEAMRHLLDEQQMDLIRQGLSAEDVTQVTPLVEALGYSNHGRATGILTSLMDDDQQPLAVRRAAVGALSKLRPGAEKLLALAKSGQYDANLKDAIAAGLHGAQWKEIKDQANELFPLPASKDDKPLPPVEQLLTRKGDAQQGRVLFNTTATCVKCHVVNNVGREVGPNLSEIGKKLSRQAIYESILFPSAGISHNYESYSLLLADGTQAAGILVSRTPEEVSIRDIEGITRTYKTGDVELIKKNDVSLMPADLQKVMTAEDLVNVVEYLTTLTAAKDFTNTKTSTKQDAPSGE
jgi:putative heme-binding domain-containing protein